MDGVTATTAELNVMDGSTSATSTTVAGADRVVLNDNGTMKQVAMTDINTYISGQATAVNDATITITAGDGLTTGGSFTTNAGTNKTITIDHSDTSSQASVNNSGNTVIQDVTLDTYGHVTGLTSKTISVATETASVSAGAVGSYLLARWYGTAVSFGSTVAGSTLTPAGFYGAENNSTNHPANGDFGGGARSGTWRCMGHTGISSTYSTARMSLFLRIS